jgi:hypothetical protein
MLNKYIFYLNLCLNFIYEILFFRYESSTTYSSATRRQTLAFGFSNAREPPDARSDARALNAQRIDLQTATQHGPCPPYNGLGGGGETPLVQRHRC